MNWFDLVTIVLLLIAIVKGYRKGLIMQLVGLAVIVLAAVFGGKLAAYILPVLNRLIDISPEFSKVLSFILAFAAIAIIISFAGRLLQRFIDVVFLSFFNRFLGSVVGAGTMMAFLSIILNLILMLDKRETVIKRDIKEESFFFERVEAVIPAIVPYLNREFWNEYVPENYREEIESKSDSIYKFPGVNTIDSAYQKKYFKVD